MNILEAVLGASNGSLVAQIAKQLGIPEPLAKIAIAALLPALAKGMQRNISQPSGLNSLVEALNTGNHSQYVDRPQTLSQPETLDDGNKILGHILGSKDVSRNVAGRASQETGIDASVLKKLLPMLGSVAMGSLAKQSSLDGERKASESSAPSFDALSVFSELLATDRDDDTMDDVLDMKRRFF